MPLDSTLEMLARTPHAGLSERERFSRAFFGAQGYVWRPLFEALIVERKKD